MSIGICFTLGYTALSTGPGCIADCISKAVLSTCQFKSNGNVQHGSHRTSAYTNIGCSITANAISKLNGSGCRIIDQGTAAGLAFCQGKAESRGIILRSRIDVNRDALLQIVAALLPFGPIRHLDSFNLESQHTRKISMDGFTGIGMVCLGKGN